MTYKYQEIKSQHSLPLDIQIGIRFNINPNFYSQNCHCSEESSIDCDIQFVMGQIIMGRMGISFVLRQWQPHAEERHVAYYYASRGGLRIALHLVQFWILTFEFWLFGGVFTLRKPWQGGVTNFGWKPPLHTSRKFISQQSTSHATQSFITPVEPQFPQLFCPCMVQFLAGIISLRRVRGPNPGHSHGSTDTLPLHHSSYDHVI